MASGPQSKSREINRKRLSFLARPRWRRGTDHLLQAGKAFCLFKEQSHRLRFDGGFFRCMLYLNSQHLGESEPWIFNEWIGRSAGGATRKLRR